MDRWYLLALLAVAGLGLLGFLGVVANEIVAVEEQVERQVAEQARRRADHETRATS
jgi:hypothetical protein